MSTQDKYDAIADSLINGQRKQAVEQMTKLGKRGIADCLAYFQELGNEELAIDAAKTYFRIKGR